MKKKDSRSKSKSKKIEVNKIEDKPKLSFDDDSEYSDSDSGDIDDNEEEEEEEENILKYEGYLYKLVDGKMRDLYFKLIHKDLYFYKNKLDFNGQNIDLNDVLKNYKKDENNEIIDIDLIKMDLKNFSDFGD